VRVLLFRECERRGRKLLFDSNAVERIPRDPLVQQPPQRDIVEVGPNYSYKVIHA